MRTLVALVCLLAATGCTRRITSKREVFEHYFGFAPPSQADIIQANYWATYRVGLDEEELVLEARLPGEFMLAKLPAFMDAPAPTLGQLEAAFRSHGGIDLPLDEAFEDAPSWFRPADRTRYRAAMPGKDFVVVSFLGPGEEPDRFQLWLPTQVRGRVFIERPSGHIYIHYLTP